MSRSPGAAGNRSVPLDGDKLRLAREARLLTREALSELATNGQAISVATIKRAERGVPVLFDRAKTLCALLGLNLASTLAPGAAPLSPVEARKRVRVAIRPLQVVGTTSQLLALADGLAADLTSRVARWWFPVVSSDSTRELAADDTKVAATKLEADYVIQGTLQLDGDRLRSNVHLLDTEQDLVVWAKTYDVAFRQVLDVQRSLTEAILAGVSEAVLDLTTARFEGLDPEDLDAWQRALLGVWHFNRRSSTDNATARGLLESALRSCSRVPIAWYTLALTHQQDLVNQWAADPRATLGQLGALCENFERLYPTLPEMNVAAAYLDVYRGERQRAMDRLQQALATDPNGCTAYGLYGQTLAMDERPDEALEQLEQALALSPFDPERCSVYTGIALSHFVAERYDETVRNARDAIRLRPGLPFPYGVVASAEALLGNVNAAQAALAQMPGAGGGLKLSGLEWVVKSTSPNVVQRFMKGLALAGVST